jgi:hypothetical protein
MTEEQKIHVAMMNSYNVITEAYSIDEVLESGIPLFSHIPDQEITMDTLAFIIYYFQEQEMYEHCFELTEFAKKNFNEDGTSKIELCQCPKPLIKNYEKKMQCACCNKRLIK